MKWFAVCFVFWISLLNTFSFAQELNLNGTATIKLSNVSPSTDLPISVEVLHSFPAYGFYEQRDTLSATGKPIWVTFPIHTVQNVFVNISTKKLNLLMMPSDTIYISIDSSKPGPAAYAIEGRNKQIQDYYEAKSARFPVLPSDQVMNAGVGDATLSDFKVLADSLYKLEKDFLDENAKGLSPWFIRFETDAIKYGNAFLRLYVYQYRHQVKHPDTNAPDNYFNFLQTVAIRNTPALYDYNYLQFLEAYVKYKSANNTKALPSQSNISTNYQKNTGLLGKQIGAFFTLYMISNALNNNPRQVEIEIDKLPALQTYSNLIAYLKQNASQRIKLLSAGKKSPNFILSDTQDSLVSLKQFRGQIIYLSFWFAGCKGCIEEFPNENELVEKFKGKPVQIVSICTRTTREKWLEKISQYGLKTVNLYANSQWGNALEEKFGINVYPQYVLIGSDGAIIENFTSRPSQGASVEIEKALSAMKFD